MFLISPSYNAMIIIDLPHYSIEYLISVLGTDPQQARTLILGGNS